jgi:hypothetical protein
LAGQGTDPKMLEERIEKKAHVVHYTRERHGVQADMVAFTPVQVEMSGRNARVERRRNFESDTRESSMPLFAPQADTNSTRL